MSIEKMIKLYPGKYICVKDVYGDLEDYVNTRKYKKREIPVDRGEKMSQNEIDHLIAGMHKEAEELKNLIESTELPFGFLTE